MQKAQKTRTLLILGLSGLVILILAVGVPGLKFKPGQPFLMELPPLLLQSSGLDVTKGGGGLQFTLRAFLLLLAVFVPIYFLIHIFTPQGRRRLLSDLIALGLLILAGIIMVLLPHQLSVIRDDFSMPIIRPSPAHPGPIATFNIHPPAWFSLLILVTLALGITTGLLHVMRSFQRRLAPPAGPLARLGLEAQQAADAIQAGEDFQNTVIRCYQQMSRILEETRDIQRPAAMTALEFEHSLAEHGLPLTPVHDLTQLFQEVRYGQLQAAGAEQQRALASLRAIAAFCNSNEVIIQRA